MKKNRLVAIAAFVVLLASLLAVLPMKSPLPAKAQVQANAIKVNFASEPAIRMQSGEIHFSDSNAPDFKPHVVKHPKYHVNAGCISVEDSKQRRYGGCVE